MNNYDLAQQILSHYFISPEEVMELCEGVSYTQEQLVRFSETIPVQEVLEWCRDNNYILVPGPNYSMSLLDIHKNQNEYFSEKSVQDVNPNFSLDDKVETKWYMIQRENGWNMESTRKNWDEQQILISEVERVPNVAEFAWVWIVFTAVRYVRLLGAVFFRTSSLDINGNHVLVGWSGSGTDDGGLEVWNHFDSHRAVNIALAISRK